ncbi:evolutionarily conserved signaling intermediate in Toll pathway, mitochondrial isoform X2 [Trichomycterus rosablanca]
MKTSRFLLQIHHTRCISSLLKNQVKSSAIHALGPSVPQICHGQALRWLHCGSTLCRRRADNTSIQETLDHETDKKSKSLVTHDDLFERAAKDAKSKASFNRVIETFSKKDIRRRGHVDFIYAALKKMPEFGVERDLAVYNKLLDVFPKEVFVPRNFIQRMFNHYPRQQECGVQLLEQMENYGIMPNVETKVLLVQIFGPKSHPMRKYQRIMYWFPKFKNLNPFPVPYELPQDPVDLARFSLNRIANDLDAKITVYQLPSTDITETGEEITNSHIVGIQGPEQQSRLAKHNPNRPVFVEGPFPLWLRKTCVHYYLLRADPVPAEEKIEEELDPELTGPNQSFFYPQHIDLDLKVDLGDDHSFDVEDVVEGAVFAMCMTGQHDQATLAKWISGLQENNPMLGQIPTVFRLDSGLRELQRAEDVRHDAGQNQHSEPESDHTAEEEVVHSQRMKQ